MPLSRTNRIDRRRRVMLDAVAADSEYAVESVRAKKRLRARELDDDSDDGYTVPYRDPGYSQAVRKTCQQRMVQWIPVRRGTMSIVLTVMWCLWAGLVFAHYWIHVRGAGDAVVAGASSSGIDTRYIAQLFHLRSTYSIAHWLTCQLWMLTAMSAWMIFQLRRHKLDDYRARYRIWAVLSVVAVFSSFDASSSVLQLVGHSIDGWARKEIGYGGWPLVLASFASIVGVLGIRLCSELRSAPTSVASWLIGLLAWAASALLGTGLLKTMWHPANVELLVGACWLGGILAVFQASGIYLRQTYIHAQKRFLQRQGANLAPIKFRLPKLTGKRNRDADGSDAQLDSTLNAETTRKKWRMPWQRGHGDAQAESSVDRGEERVAKKRSVRTQEEQGGSSRFSETAASTPTAPAANIKGMASPNSASSIKQADSARQASEPNEESTKKTRGGLFGFIPNRQSQNEKLESEPIRQDDGPAVDQGLTKTRGWFGVGGNRATNRTSPAEKPETNQTAAKPSSTESNRKEVASKPTLTSDGQVEKRSLWPLKKKSPSNKADKDTAATSETGERKQGWISKFGRGKKSDAATQELAKAPGKEAKSNSNSVDGKDASKEPGAKKSWFGTRSEKTAAPKPAKKVEPTTAAKSADKPAKKGFFGMFDALKLAPPNDDRAVQGTNAGAKPVAVQAGQKLPSTQHDADEDDTDDNISGRPMSKAERKKQRRMQQDDRRAA